MRLSPHIRKTCARLIELLLGTWPRLLLALWLIMSALLALLLTLELHIQQSSHHGFGYILAQARQKPVKERKGFGFIFIERISLAISPHPNNRFKRVQLLQMFPPVFINNLQ